jgi:hypothetical protein
MLRGIYGTIFERVDLDLYFARSQFEVFWCGYFGAAWSLTCSAIVILLSSVKEHAAPKRTRQKPQIVTARSIIKPHLGVLGTLKFFF